MRRSEFYEEHLTDSRGQFVVEIDPGEHTVTVTKPGYAPFTASFAFVEDTDRVVAALQPSP